MVDFCRRPCPNRIEINASERTIHFILWVTVCSWNKINKLWTDPYIWTSTKIKFLWVPRMIIFWFLSFCTIQYKKKYIKGCHWSTVQMHQHNFPYIGRSWIDLRLLSKFNISVSPYIGEALSRYFWSHLVKCDSRHLISFLDSPFLHKTTQTLRMIHNHTQLQQHNGRIDHNFVFDIQVSHAYPNARRN